MDLKLVDRVKEALVPAVLALQVLILTSLEIGWGTSCPRPILAVEATLSTVGQKNEDVERNGRSSDVWKGSATCEEEG